MEPRRGGHTGGHLRGHESRLHLTPSVKCASLDLAGLDRLTNIGPYVTIFSLANDATPPTISALSVKRRHVDRQCVAGNTWINTTSSTTSACTDSPLTCAGNTGVKLSSLGYHVTPQGLVGGAPDT